VTASYSKSISFSLRLDMVFISHTFFAPGFTNKIESRSLLQKYAVKHGLIRRRNNQR
jgi:hypothetical protein